MDKVQGLMRVLKRLNAGDDPEKVKKEARQLLESISPKDLAIAEQKLIEEGLDPEDLRRLCDTHMGVLKNDLQKLKKRLEPGHVIHTLTGEHDMILGFLDELEELNESIQKMENYEGRNEKFKKLIHVAEHLVEAELHHKREEEVLFPEVEKRGVFGPPQVMRMEHEGLRKRKKELLNLGKNIDKLDFNEFKKRLDEVAKFIIPTLRDHIFKENNILYPTALEVIQEKEMWDKMKSSCDKIGYCCFTPGI